ncbi:unnamed protein product, partial [Owenia fusiformis]
HHIVVLSVRFEASISDSFAVPGLTVDSPSGYTLEIELTAIDSPIPPSLQPLLDVHFYVRSTSGWMKRLPYTMTEVQRSRLMTGVPTSAITVELSVDNSAG